MPLLPAPAVAATLPPSLSFNGKKVLVTGSTSGLGLAAATLYHRLGASHLIITARDAAKGAVAKTAIETAATSVPNRGTIEVRVLDMSTFSAVEKFMHALKAEVTEIDVVLLNAGVIEFEHKKSPDGWESDLQVNTLSTALLALLMVPWMRSVRREKQVQHLTIVGSRTHMTVDILGNEWPKKDVLAYWSQEKNYQPGGPSYAISKLLVHYAANEIAALAAAGTGDGGPSPIFNTMCPGSVSTDLSRNFTSRSVLHKAFVKLYLTVKRGLTADEGAKSLVLATTVEAKENGKMMAPGLTDAEYEKHKSKNMTNEAGKAMQAEVWREIVQVLEKAVPEVGKIVRGS